MRRTETATETAVATFAAGCFWGVQDAFDRRDGVVATTAGYTGGTVAHPTYEQVCTGETGHAEAVRVTYDPKIVSYEELLSIFFAIHDPTQRNRQGPDVGTQYRSAIFYHDENQRDAAENMKNTLHKDAVTEIVPAGAFWEAEDYHQHYFKKHGRTGCPVRL